MARTPAHLLAGGARVSKRDDPTYSGGRVRIERMSDEWALRIQLEKEEARVAALEKEVKRLLDTNAVLRGRNDYLERTMAMRGAQGAARGSGVTEAELRDLIFQFHPDRNPAGLDPATVTRELIKLRDRVRT
jgi:hypothetical protein